MRIIVDGDACPVLAVTEKIAKEKEIELIVVSDPNHLLYLEYGKHIVVDHQSDGADYYIVNHSRQEDIIITSDYGLAGLALAKQAVVLHPKGFIYTQENIDELLFTRFLSKKQRRANQKNHLKGPRKREKEEDQKFYQLLLDVIEKG